MYYYLNNLYNTYNIIICNNVTIKFNVPTTLFCHNISQFKFRNDPNIPSETILKLLPSSKCISLLLSLIFFNYAPKVYRTNLERHIKKVRNLSRIQIGKNPVRHISDVYDATFLYFNPPVVWHQTSERICAAFFFSFLLYMVKAL